jgi:hypothetical protein
MKKSMVLILALSAFVGALIVSSVAHACGEGSMNNVVLTDGELPGGG